MLLLMCCVFEHMHHRYIIGLGFCARGLLPRPKKKNNKTKNTKCGQSTSTGSSSRELPCCQHNEGTLLHGEPRVFVGPRIENTRLEWQAAPDASRQTFVKRVQRARQATTTTMRVCVSRDTHAHATEITFVACSSLVPVNCVEWMNVRLFTYAYVKRENRECEWEREMVSTTCTMEVGQLKCVCAVLCGEIALDFDREGRGSNCGGCILTNLWCVAR